MKKGNIGDKRVDPKVKNDNAPTVPPAYIDFKARAVTSKPFPGFADRPVEEYNWERPNDLDFGAPADSCGMKPQKAKDTQTGGNSRPKSSTSFSSQGNSRPSAPSSFSSSPTISVGRTKAK